MFQWSQNVCKFSAFSLEFQKFFWITRTIFSQYVRTILVTKYHYVLWIRSFGWPGGRKVLSDSQKRSIIFWSTWNCTQCQAYDEENVGWARHELPEGGGEVYVWLGAMIIDHGTDFFRYFNRITYQSLVLTYHSSYAMNFLLWWVKLG